MKRFLLPLAVLMIGQSAVRAEFRQIDLTIFGMD